VRQYPPNTQNRFILFYFVYLYLKQRVRMINQLNKIQYKRNNNFYETHEIGIFQYCYCPNRNINFRQKELYLLLKVARTVMTTE